MTVIESRQNGTLRHLSRLAREKKYRVACGEMLCEGEKMLYEALSSGVSVRTVLLHEDADSLARGLALQAEAAGAKLFSALGALLRQASDVETPQGVVFSCVPPVFGEGVIAGASRVLLLDGLQDPGNMGTILRTADAFALDAVVLCEGCTDPYAPKVVRATMGAIFRLPTLRLPRAAAFAACRAAGLPVYAAALAEGSLPVQQAALSRCAVAIGNEGRGVSAETLAACDQKIIIPMDGRAESLNAGVAAAILMWEMARKNARNDIT
ncbi:RNA methyltransferase [Intestinibacillus massiliensis]|nr:RNA methyltransferase [Intestinibacillus massiliensis]